MEFTPEQHRAVHHAMTERLSLVSGSAGTGKTTALRAIVASLEASGEEFMLVAPTGKAASRISTHVGYPASTIHRALGWHPETGSPIYTSTNPWPVRCVIVDESSMIDIALAARLMGAIGPETRLVLVGDDKQLPPVGAGALFADLLRYKSIPNVRLTRPFRQSSGSAIADAAYAILDGQMPVSSKSFSDESSFYFIERTGPDETIKAVHNLVAKAIPRAVEGIDEEQLQVLVPMREGPVSVAALNAMLVKHWNPTAHEWHLSAGDRVLHTKNNYELGVFNGDMGRVLKARRDGSLSVNINGNVVEYTSRTYIAQLVRAWAVSVHKAQGSEWDVVVICLAAHHGRLLNRSLLYTAVTRARRLAVIVGSKAAMRKCLSTVQTARDTNLLSRIKRLQEESQ